MQRPAKVGLVAYHLAGHQDVLLGDMNRRYNEVLASLIIEGTPPAASDFNSARLKLVLSGPPLGMHRKSPCMLAIRVDYEILQDAPEKHSCTVSLELCASSLHSKRQIETEVPAGKTVHAVVDNYATHKHPMVRAWLARHPR